MIKNLRTNKRVDTKKHFLKNAAVIIFIGGYGAEKCCPE
jgi:hypothetical protein